MPLASLALKFGRSEYFALMSFALTGIGTLTGSSIAKGIVLRWRPSGSIPRHRAGQLQFFGEHAPLLDQQRFARYLAPLRTTEWVVYSKRPFGGAKAVLVYLARYTHRVAISNSRLISADDDGVTFKWKDYRLEGSNQYKLMKDARTGKNGRTYWWGCSVSLSSVG